MENSSSIYYKYRIHSDIPSIQNRVCKEKEVSILKCPVSIPGVSVSIAAVRKYRRRYPHRRVPESRTFSRAMRILRENVESRGRPSRTSDEEVLELVAVEPRISTREISRQTAVSQPEVSRILRREGYHPYHFQRVQGLETRDFQPRIQFCRWIVRNRSLLPYILWTDEATFTRNGILNIHNEHEWATQNPHLCTRSHFQAQFRVNMWAGVIGNQLIGPIELPARINGETFLNFLENDLEECLDDLPLSVRARMWLQLDGAPPHTSRSVRNFLNERFRDKWIGRYGPIAWPPRSPDLNPLDFFIWGYLKTNVYREEINSVEDLKNKISLAAQGLRPNIRSVTLKNDLLRRARACIQANGDNFEHYL